MARQIDTLISFSDTLLSLFSHQLIAVLELGCRRLLFDNGYLASLHRPNVTMDWSGIDSMVEDGIMTKKGGKIAYMVFVQLIFHRRKTWSWRYHIFNRFHNRVSWFLFSLRTPTDACHSGRLSIPRQRAGNHRQELLWLCRWTQGLQGNKYSRVSKSLFDLRFVLQSESIYSSESENKGPNSGTGHTSFIYSEEVQVG